MKSHRLRLLVLLLFEDLDDLLLLEVDVAPFFPFDTLEVSASSESRKENCSFWNPLPFGHASAILSFFDVHATQNNIPTKRNYFPYLLQWLKVCIELYRRPVHAPRGATATQPMSGLLTLYLL